MILDKYLTFCDGVSAAAAAGTALVGDVIDLDTIGRRIGSSQNISFRIAVETTFTSGGSATVQFALASDAAAAIATDGTATTHWTSDVFDFDDLTAGVVIHSRLPSGFPTAERYLGLLVTTATATTTAGVINAELLLDVQDWVALPDAVN